MAGCSRNVGRGIYETAAENGRCWSRLAKKNLKFNPRSAVGERRFGKVALCSRVSFAYVVLPIRGSSRSLRVSLAFQSTYRAGLMASDRYTAQIRHATIPVFKMRSSGTL